MSSAIFADRTAFDEMFVPEKIIAREGQIKQIANELQEVTDNDFTVYLYVYGPPGLGKTLICKSLLKKRFDEKVVYVDCFHKNSQREIMEQILSQGSLFLAGRRTTNDMKYKLERSRKKFVVCLDRCEFLKDCDIVYYLMEQSCGIVLISNKPFSLSKLSIFDNSRLYMEEIEFKPYGKDEILQIIKERVEYGLIPNKISRSQMSIISGLANGDARRALQMVKLSARKAEVENHDKIMMSDIRSSAIKTGRLTVSKPIKESGVTLKKYQQDLLSILKRRRIISSGDLFRELQNASQEKVNDRNYRNQVRSLRELGLIKERGSTKGKMYELA